MESKGVFKVALDYLSARVIHIDEVPEGFESAICPECRSPLIAANRNPNSRVKSTYFRHRVESSCNGETLIHLWAKQVIADRLSVLGARYVAFGEAKDVQRKLHEVEIQQQPEYLTLRSCELEKSLFIDGYTRVPDVSARLNSDGDLLNTDEDLFIEIFVHNAVDDPRSNFYQNSKLNCLEIDLSGLPPEYLKSPDLFETHVISGAPRKWVSCSLYSDLHKQAQIEAESRAKAASDRINKQKDKNRSEKSKWREQNEKLVKLIQAYLEPENQRIASEFYEQQLGKSGTLSFNTKQYLLSRFGSIPEIVNVPLKGELGFSCHRCAWQWEIYRRLVIDGFRKVATAAKRVKHHGAARGFEKEKGWSAWDNYPPEWSAESLYSELLTIGIQVRPVCSEAEKTMGQPILAERDKPDELKGLMVKEWREMPKPVCVIRRYLQQLVKLELVETIGNDYVIKKGVNPPLC